MGKTRKNKYTSGGNRIIHNTYIGKGDIIGERFKEINIVFVIKKEEWLENT